jgi:hypothetical protein
MPELTIHQCWNFRLLARTGPVLKLLNSVGRPASVSEVAAILGISSPTARRYLASLEGLRMVVHSPETGRYTACADFDALLAGSLEPEAAAEVVQPVADQVADQAAGVGPDAAPPAQEARENQPAQMLPRQMSVQNYPPTVGKKIFSPPGAVVAVEYLINLNKRLTATTTAAPPGGKIFPSARAPASARPLAAQVERQPCAHAPPGSDGSRCPVFSRPRGTYRSTQLCIAP